jgi:hypothetical protein
MPKLKMMSVDEGDFDLVRDTTVFLHYGSTGTINRQQGHEIIIPSWKA